MLRKQWQTVVLKLIRRNLPEREKKQIQARLQQAFSGNGKGFYVYAPKQKGKVKEQLRYIGRYIRRPAIGLNRVEAYDGEFVTFRYYDKTDRTDKTETVSVEEFIARLIRHIPDEQFKTVRHYGVYARRIKGLCKKMLAAWQREVRRWVVQVKRVIRRQTWRERVVASGKKDPLVCSRCECYYEYKGEVCLKEGILQIAVALCRTTRTYLERMIAYLTSVQTTKKENKKEIQRVREPAETECQLCLFGMP